MADTDFIESCNSCIYFDNTQNNIMGVCRRYPTYQNRHGTEWCGEYRSTKPVKVINRIIEEVTTPPVIVSFKKSPGRPKKVKDES